MKNLNAALETFFAREARREHPSGSFDKASRWFPDAAEQQNCCHLIRQPTRAWPHSLNKHCRTAEHVANLYNVDAKALRKAINAQRKIDKTVNRLLGVTA